MSAMADNFDEKALEAEAEAAKKHADALLEDVEKERRHTDRLRLKDHGEVRDRRRRSRSRERDRCKLWDLIIWYHPFACSFQSCVSVHYDASLAILFVPVYLGKFTRII